MTVCHLVGAGARCYWVRGRRRRWIASTTIPIMAETAEATTDTNRASSQVHPAAVRRKYATKPPMTSPTASADDTSHSCFAVVA